jgi:hypothetical protein
MVVAPRRREPSVRESLTTFFDPAMMVKVAAAWASGLVAPATFPPASASIRPCAPPPGFWQSDTKWYLLPGGAAALAPDERLAREKIEWWQVESA